jgi:hypothetical protein
MNGEPVFFRRLLTAWIAVVIFAVSLYLMGRGGPGARDSIRL